MGKEKKYKKKQKAKKTLIKKQTNVVHTKISLTLGWLSIAVLSLIGFVYLDDIWGTYALFQALLGLIGIFGSTLIREGKLKPTIQPSSIDKTVLTLSRALFMLLIIVLIQYTVQVTLTIRDEIRALYYISVAVTEELFFRGFLQNILLKLTAPIDDNFLQGTIEIGIPVTLQASLFVVMHTNYYDNPAALYSVFFGGIFLGIGYYIFDDLTANILSHFLLNLWVAGSLLVSFSSKPTIEIIFTIIDMSLSIFLVYEIYELRKNKEENKNTIVKLQILLFILLILLVNLISYLTIGEYLHEYLIPL